MHLAAAAAGVLLAVAVSHAGGMSAIWARWNSVSERNQNSSVAAAESDLNREEPQKQAEILLERAVTRSHGSPDEIEAQIQSRVETWRGKLKWDTQLGQLTTAALNSSDSSVRVSAIEVQLAAYGISKSRSSVDALVRRANSADHRQKIWAFWTLGLLANRGIETDRIIELLSDHLKKYGRENDRDSPGKDSDDARRWAVEGLALVGTTPTIAPLLEAMRNDPSPTVRERAACGLAESGSLSHDQRLIAVPELIRYSDDPALDAQTQGWAFQALQDITRQRLPNDSAAWRSWYQNHSPDN